MNYILIPIAITVCLFIVFRYIRSQAEPQTHHLQSSEDHIDFKIRSDHEVAQELKRRFFASSAAEKEVFQSCMLHLLSSAIGSPILFDTPEEISSFLSERFNRMEPEHLFDINLTLVELISEIDHRDPTFAPAQLFQVTVEAQLTARTEGRLAETEDQSKKVSAIASRELRKLTLEAISAIVAHEKIFT
ncbi:hypothetical protein [Pseudovibrio sp. POLY-S9]|uniref:hypothetical protein n=1 Tax=Pseudovibrio sp. POLY-S9 TaxID=1576596 RepID=UPI00070B33C1|nr:hypothetical protein [Pseudovibrio sp. POLY-S9]